MAYEVKTKATDVDVDVFIATSPRSTDGATGALLADARKVSGLEPKMWGPGIVGFGSRKYELAGGKQGDMLAMGFAPRKTSLVLLHHQARARMG